ncbi:winged helix-turn-helix transcriptional regulator [Candidatus Bathyarchaeota archaeon]|nr:winged helix-turn-helix transcriptional regulator [Candidatus Bathyarchaeota archaeon]
MKNLWKEVIAKLSPETSTFKALIYLAFSKESCKPADISSGTGISPGTIRPALRSLLKMGFLIQEADGSYKSKIPFTEIVSSIFQSKD